MNPYDYGITVRRVTTEDGPCFAARVRELPDVAEFADTHAEAYELAIDTIETTAAALAAAGRALPPPAPPLDDYSGRITVRVTKALHRDLALAASEEGVSLNLLISTALAQFAGSRARPAEVDTPHLWIPAAQVPGTAKPKPLTPPNLGH